MLLVIGLAMVLLYFFTLPQSRTVKQFQIIVNHEKKAAGLEVDEAVEEERGGDGEGREEGEDTAGGSEKPEEGKETLGGKK